MKGNYIQLKINNEIALCEVPDLATKDIVERELIKNRISYFINWQRTGLFHHGREVGIFCVNENHKAQAEDIIKSLASKASIKMYD